MAECPNCPNCEKYKHQIAELQSELDKWRARILLATADSDTDTSTRCADCDIPYSWDYTKVVEDRDGAPSICFVCADLVRLEKH